MNCYSNEIEKRKYIPIFLKINLVIYFKSSRNEHNDIEFVGMKVKFVNKLTLIYRNIITNF